ncbi:unnamed protein product [Chilo suppressalis]|uniref:C2H2-type domain-containing protein n=1 Tax=Chilo suppressalis TaxID=168631 RepID=A0ABN8AV41_CHISP|nr:unnamed protein product [Chilo suppressalis]
MTSLQEFNCVFCKEFFDNKEELQIHFRKHGDPKFNPSSRIKNRPVNVASDEKRNEDVEMVSCDVCTEEFPTISKAITHKHKVHPDHDAKYFCPWCGKLFTMKHLYNKHLQTNHKELERSHEVNFHCDICNVDFFIAAAMLYHNKFFHRQDTNLSSIGQSKKLKMINNDVLQIFYCSFCGDEYDNKVNLHKHMLDDHGDENQSPEDVLRCPLCEAIFYHLDAYELHLTFHSNDDLYVEKNELFEQLTEFSLETVPPLMEKVENVESQDAENALNAVGLEKFLEMAMDTPDDNDSDKPKKSKKHKKHKKSKKSAITLDEFLNMNKDVFGEGLDFQGIEEVPTKAVAKGLKKKKLDKPNLKVVESKDLDKLKKQGIIVKMNSKKLPAQAVMIGNELPNKSSQIQQQSTCQTKIPTTDEVISKLLNQGNSQIKIVKKSSHDNSTDKDIKSTGADNINKSPTPENIEVESDLIHNVHNSSETEAKLDTESQVKSSYPRNDVKKNMPIASSFQNLDENLQLLNHTNSICSKKLACDDDETEKPFNKDLIDKDENNDSPEINSAKLKPKIVSNNITLKPSISDNYRESEENIHNQPKCKGDVTDTENVTSSPSKNNSSKHSLDALKHLSHLITVKSVSAKGSPPVQTIPNRPETPSKDEKMEIIHSENISDQNDEVMSESLSNIETSNGIQSNEKKGSFNTIDALKSLNKNIIVKPVMLSPKNITEKTNDNADALKNCNTIKTSVTTIPERKPIEQSTVNMEPILKPPKPSPKLKQIDDSNISEKLEKQSANVNLLKHLTNITAKPINKNNQVSPPERTKNNFQVLDKKSIAQTDASKKLLNDDIEIFNIDDSDSDDGDASTLIGQKVNTTKVVSNDTSNKSFEKLKTAHNVTVKSLKQQMTQINKNITKQMPPSKETLHNNPCSMSDFSDEDDQDMLMPANLSINQKLSLQSSNIQALKNLGKFITVKSRNSSLNVPSIRDLDLQEEMDDADSDNDLVPDKVKITELDNDNFSDDEVNDRKINNKHNLNVSVQSPEASNSDHENDFMDDPDEELSDFETHLKTNTLKKPSLENAQGLNLEIKKLNKNVTIKPINKYKKDDQPTSSKSLAAIPISNSKELSIKPFRQTKASVDIDTLSGKNNNVTKAIRTVNQSLNQNVASNSQVSTVNKEVTVKTFETQTVIQEITTTVTKTIKTVNQTVKQQIQSSSQVSQPMKYQKVQGMNPTQNVKNIQGVTVRQAAPITGTKVRGLTPTRLAMGSTVRPSNQLVPVRPSLNPLRANTPRMQAVKKVANPSSNQLGQNLVRPVKIASNVTTKRASEDTTGHFSCFKKPKESLIPISDIPNFDNEQMNSTVHYTSSHSKSNFSSSTKTVRGNTVVAAAQMKTETSSSDHISKLNNLSGLKIVKTSQSKQTMQVEEKSKLSASQRNTLEAIEKLQKQGLLIKKPRVVNNDSEHSDSEHEQYLTEEPED